MAMTPDSQGNTLEAVGVPLTGFAAVQLEGEPEFVDSAVGGKPEIIMPKGYKKVGLFKNDGGPAESGDAGDTLEFFQDGYKLTGASSMTVAINLAEMNEHVRRLTTGKKPDANGMITIDAAVPNNIFPLFIAIQYKNGVQRRMNGMARIASIEKDQTTRGEVHGQNVTFEWVRNDKIDGLYREWIILPSAARDSLSVGE